MNTIPASRAVVFASTHFPSCAAHREEGEAVHRALEKIARQELPELDPDVPLAAILRFDPPASSDSLDVLEHLMALEEEFGEGLVPGESEVSVATWRRAVMAALLGSAATYCTWEPDTMWVRSARGIINERARRRKDCRCRVGDEAVQQ